MHGLGAVDPGRSIDWGKTSSDYAEFRPGPPDSFYKKLSALDIGLPGQTILDLGTGTGVLARAFARNGSIVSGTDISSGQIEAAKKLADSENVSVTFKSAPAENNPFPDHSFDVITANQCWLYFDLNKVIPEVKRLLKPNGVLVTSHFSWLPRVDAVAKASEQLILKFNPQWSASDFSGEIPSIPNWAKEHFCLKGMFFYDEAIPFNKISWRGRMRACRGVGAALSPQEVEKFDQEHQKLLDSLVPAESFKIIHRIDAHILQFRE